MAGTDTNWYHWHSVEDANSHLVVSFEDMLGRTRYEQWYSSPASPSSNDNWGNVTSRTYNTVGATLSYDLLDNLVQWNAGANSQEWYAYTTGGNRSLRRSTTGSGTTITVYAFGLEEHVYSSTGTPQSSTYSP